MLRWRYSVKIYIQRSEVNSREWERMVEDRDGWKRLIKKAEQIK